ncbi:MAG: hypothetical protein ACREJC_16265, partial [Tepidisphaeraceae bacterium]
LASTTQAAITVSSEVSTSGGIRAQAIITDPNGIDSRGAAVTAVAIKEIHSTIFIRDDSIFNGISVEKRPLTAAEAYGFGLTNGYTDPPTTDPTGPWFGLVWPYRDQYDYFPNAGDPLGDDVGIPFEDQPGVYQFLNVNAIERGGPTDPVGPPGQNTPAWLTRGLTGNGLDGPATYFAMDIQALIGPFDRNILLRIIAAEATVVVKDNETGEYSEQTVTIGDFSRLIPLPEPASAILWSFGVLGLLSRRRR